MAVFVMYGGLIMYGRGWKGTNRGCGGIPELARTSDESEGVHLPASFFWQIETPRTLNVVSAQITYQPFLNGISDFSVSAACFCLECFCLEYSLTNMRNMLD